MDCRKRYVSELLHSAEINHEQEFSRRENVGESAETWDEFQAAKILQDSPASFVENPELCTDPETMGGLDAVSDEDFIWASYQDKIT